MRIGACGLLALLVSCDEPPKRDSLDFVPADAAVVAQIHAPSLFRSPVFRKHLLGGPAGRQLDELTTSCGYDPLPRVADVTFVMLPQGALRGEFAAVVEGRLDHLRLAECARRLAQQRGEQLRVTRWSGAEVLRRPGGSGAIALVGGESPCVVVGEGHLVRQMLHRAAKRAASIRGVSDVTDLLERLGAERPIRVVVQPTASLREEVRGRLIAPLAPLVDARAVGLGVSVGVRLDITLLARLPDAGAARRFARGLEDAAARADNEPLLDLTAIGAPLRSFAAEAHGRDTVAVVSATERQIEAILRELDGAAASP